MAKRVLSGIRATGRLHLGNYLGALKGMLELEHDPDYETMYMVADVHAVTTPYNVEELRVNRREVLIDYLAAGLDPDKSVLFLQSDVKEHAELTYYLSSLITIARMRHLPTFKEKVKQYPQHATMALLAYPILMSADILVYKADSVPVGIDQEPHLEVAREIARKMNEQYGMDFPEPERFKTRGEYVPSLTGEGKMSKSVEGSFINLTDGLDEIAKRLAKVPTDAGKGEVLIGENKKAKIYRSENGESKGVGVLMEMVELFEGEKKRNEMESLYKGGGIRYGDLKSELSEAIYKELKPIQEKRKLLVQDKERVDKVIKQGADKAREIARKTLAQVRTQMGLL